MVEMTIQKEFTLIKQVNQKNVCFVITGILKTLLMNLNHVCNGCHAVSVMAYELKKIAIVNVKGVDCRCILWGIIKNDVVERLNSSASEDKGVS